MGNRFGNIKICMLAFQVVMKLDDKRRNSSRKKVTHKVGNVAFISLVCKNTCKRGVIET